MNHEKQLQMINEKMHALKNAILIIAAILAFLAAMLLADSGKAQELKPKSLKPWTTPKEWVTVNPWIPTVRYPDSYQFKPFVTHRLSIAKPTYRTEYVKNQAYYNRPVCIVQSGARIVRLTRADVDLLSAAHPELKETLKSNTIKNNDTADLIIALER